jgi:hypothetical protein
LPNNSKSNVYDFFQMMPFTLNTLTSYVHSGPAWGLQALHGQSDVCIGCVASGRSYFLRFTEHCATVEQSCCEGCCQGSKFVFIQDLPPPPTFNQSCRCGALQSPLHCYTISRGTELSLAIASPFIQRLRPHFRIKHKLALRQMDEGRIFWAKLIKVHCKKKCPLCQRQGSKIWILSIPSAPLQCSVGETVRCSAPPTSRKKYHLT